jgi:uncharacterized delta-60 repeat protein
MFSTAKPLRFAFIHLTCVAAIWLTLSLPRALQSADGEVDGNFEAGIYGSVDSIVEQRDGKVIIGGSFKSVQGVDQRYLARLNEDSSMDLSFRPVFDGLVTKVIILEDGAMFVGGGFNHVNGVPRGRLAKLNPDGSLVNDFVPAIPFNQTIDLIKTMALQPDGRLFVASLFGTFVRLNLNGTHDAGFNLSYSNSPALPSVHSIIVQPDAKIIIGGNFTQVGGSTQIGLVRLNSNGSRDSTWTTGLFGAANALTLQEDGKILVGGSFSGITRSGVFYSRSNFVRLHADGSYDSTLNAQIGGSAKVSGILSLHDGRLLIRGGFSSAGGRSWNGVAMLNANGAADFSWVAVGLPGTLQQSVNTICSLRSGDFLIGGDPLNQAGVALTTIARLQGSGGHELEVYGNFAEWLRFGTAPQILPPVVEHSSDGVTWIPSGTMTKFGSSWTLSSNALLNQPLVRARARVVSDQSHLSGHVVEVMSVLPPLAPEIRVSWLGGSELNDAVGEESFASVAEEKTFLIENIGTGPLLLGTLKKSGSLPAAFRLNGAGFKDILPPGGTATVSVVYDPPLTVTGARTCTLSLPCNDADESVFEISLVGAAAPSRLIPIERIVLDTDSNPANGAISIAGGFHPYLKSLQFTIPANQMSVQLITSSSAVGWSGITMEVDGAPATMGVHPLIMTRAATHVFTVKFYALDGMTTDTYTITVLRAAATPGQVDLSFKPPMPSSPVQTVAVQTDGSLLVGGQFITIGGLSIQGLAKLASDGTVDAAFSPRASGIYCIRTQPGGGSIIGGTFVNVGGSPQKGIAKLDASGVRLSDLSSPYLNVSTGVRAILEEPHSLLSGGRNPTVLGLSKASLLLLGPDGTADFSFQCEGSEVITNALARLPDGSLLAGREKLKRYDIFGRELPWATTNNTVHCLLPLPDGRFLIGGSFTEVTGTAKTLLARVNADGTLDTTFSSSLVGVQVQTLALQADGKVLVGGSFTLGTHSHVVRLMPSGAHDTTFNTRVSATEITTLALQKNGKVVLGGSFTSVHDVPDQHLTTLANNAATESLTVPSHDKIIWQRGGSSPEAQAVWFELSTDAGQTWQALKSAQRISGGWEITSLALPSSGRIRARALTISGLGCASTGIVESTLDYSLTAAEITLLDPAQQSIADGATMEFNEVGTTSGARQDFQLTLRNDGAVILNGIQTVITGSTDFKITQAPPVSVAPGASAPLHLSFTPKTAGVKTASLSILSSDADESSFDLALSGVGVKSSAFTVTTGKVEQVTTDSGVALGSVNAAGNARRVYMDYGLTAALGQTIATSPSTVDGVVSTPVQAVLAGLVPGTKYFYRFRASSALGATQGSVQSFVTQAAANPIGAQVTGSTNAAPEGGNLVLQVVAASSWWQVTGLPSWIKTSSTLSFGSGPLTLVVSPNAAKTPRQVTLKIAGISIMITQSAVTAAAMISGLPSVKIEGVVNQPFRLQLGVTGQPATVTATGLPTGLKISPGGLITGVFAKAALSTAKITARNAFASSVPVDIQFDVRTLPSVPGVYQGFIPRDQTLNQNLGSRFEMTVTSTGAYSGKLITGITPVPFAGKLGYFEESESFFATVKIPKAEAIQLIGTIHHSEGVIRAGLENEDGSVTLAFSAWQAMTTPAPRRNLAFSHSSAALSDPYGYSFASLTPVVGAKNGSINVIGRLADGSALSFSSHVGRHGQVLLYQSLYGARGSFAGAVNGHSLTWMKPPLATPTTKDSLYRDGFGPLTLSFQGDSFPDMLPGAVVPGAAVATAFTHSALLISWSNFNITAHITNPTASGLTNKITVNDAVNPQSVVFTSFNPVTGAFSGTFTLPGATAAQKRVIAFHGLLVKSGILTRGYGWFILPESTAANALQTSGRVLMSAF